ncbi:hypothetical protein HDV05_002020, partial [Chytridiales sp. JEL 0842]
MKSLTDLLQVDPSRFAHDDEYRLESLMDLARSDDPSKALLSALGVSAQLGVEPSVLALERLLWMVEFEGVDENQVVEAFEELNDYLVEAETLNGLKRCHASVQRQGFAKLTVYYNVILKLLKDDGNAVQQDLISSIIERCKHIAMLESSGFPMLTSSSIPKLLKLNAQLGHDTNLEFYRQLFEQDGGDFKSLVRVLDIVSKIKTMSPIYFFDDESALVGSPLERPAAACRAISARLALDYLNARFEDVDWEYEEAESVSSDFKELAFLARHLDVAGLMQLLESFTVGERALSVSIELRIGLAATVKERCGMIHSGDKIDELRKRLKDVQAHLRMIDAMYTLRDSSTGSTLELERVQQFDDLFGEDVSKV